MKTPRWIVRLLEALLHPDEHDETIGDLEEVHRERSERAGPIAATVGTVAEGLFLAVTHGARRVVSALRDRNTRLSWLEVRLALRLVLKQPVMTLTAVSALGIGIGIAAGAFSVFQQSMYSALPFENGDRWVVIQSYSEETGRRTRLDLERLAAFRAGASAFEYIAGSESLEINVVADDGGIERLAAARVTPGTFAYLPYTPLLGRLLNRSDGRPSAEPVVLIRESFWDRAFGRDPGVLDESLALAGVDHRVVGVLPDEARYPSEGELWIPLDEESAGATAEVNAVAGTRLPAILVEGATIEQADAQLARISTATEASIAEVEVQRHRILPITRTMSTGQGQLILILVMAVLVSILTVIAANVANLIVARTSRREAELAVRSALGASRSRIVAQLFVEVLAIGVPAAIIGLGLAGMILRWYDGILDELPFWVQLELDPWTAVAVATLALTASGVMGLIPAMRATGDTPARALREAGGRSTLGIGRFGSAMIALEVALSVALLGTGVVFARGFQAYVDPMVHLPEGQVLTARMVMDVGPEDLVEGGAVTVADSIGDVLARLEEGLKSVPGVRGVGFTTHLPRAAPFPELVEIDGETDLARAGIALQGPGVFDVLGIEPVLGRDFSEEDRLAEALPVAIVNAAFATETFGTTQVLGRRVREAPPAGGETGPWHTIVGVVPNVMEVTSSAGAAIYLPLTAARFVSVTLRTDTNPMALSGPLRRVAFDVDRQMILSEIVPLEEVGSENRQALSAMTGALAAVGLTTLLLALAGIYSIVSLAVTRRTKEIGVRVALGAEPTSIVWSVMGRSGGLVLGGAILGAAAGTAFSRARPFAFALPDPGPFLYPTLVIVMTFTAGLACWVPLRRALAIQPVEALGGE